MELGKTSQLPPSTGGGFNPNALACYGKHYPWFFECNGNSKDITGHAAPTLFGT
ncbi:MAG: hypothetical protein ACTS73_01520 [Arsenophonus sp. NEOnobi-MAG3]